MTDNDQQIWGRYTRGITHVCKKKRNTSGAKPTKTRKDRNDTTLSLLRVSNNDSEQDFAITLERNREKAFRQGNIEIDAKLDLHGLTQAEAFEALAAFVNKNVNAGKRLFLVITGKGPAGTGVLRRHFKSWLTQLPEARRILTVKQAAIKHGGEGAFYVLMKKG